MKRRESGNLADDRKVFVLRYGIWALIDRQRAQETNRVRGELLTALSISYAAPYETACLLTKTDYAAREAVDEPENCLCLGIDSL